MIDSESKKYEDSHSQIHNELKFILMKNLTTVCHQFTHLFVKLLHRQFDVLKDKSNVSFGFIKEIMRRDVIKITIYCTDLIIYRFL